MMEHPFLYINLGLILAFVAGNAFFVGSEIAISSARRSRIRQLAEEGDKRAARVEMLHNEPERFYSVTQVGITLVSLGLGAVGMETISTLTDSTFVSIFALFGDSEALVKAAHTVSYVFAFVVISFLHVVAGELAPKVLAFHKAEQMSMAVGGIINLLYLTFRPLIYIMKLSSDALLRLFGQQNLGGEGHNSHFTMSVEEIRMILSASEKDGTLAPEETEMIRGVFKLDEHTVREAMIPRTRIRALAQEDTLADALRIFRDVPHARFPVYDKSLDRITGVVAIKELLTVMAESTGQTLQEVSHRPVGDFVQAPYVVPNSKLLSDLLKDFKRTRQQMAVVIDEYGGTEGIITLEDILEEIVGDYEDEFTRQARRVRKLLGSQYEIDASMRVSDLDALLDFPFPTDDDYVTLAGLFYKRHGSVPKVGDTVQLEGGQLTVLEMDNHRITLLKFEDTAVGEDGVVRLVENSSAADVNAPSAEDSHQPDGR
ncbi:hemolysin family protein [Candidatus Accumulibacter vicinus]|uniref:Hemolysin C n=1 Tax=Candidatus Accumulibacter vicinus TaxID=2954382 RepID=A0A084Y117_9PROT|nr:hemolysin family protein [Candidatus Accumulibacter vicinus]KFB68411.1 MAG: Hemolysin C [Candidatus Accumulibacter vicinus]